MSIELINVRGSYRRAMALAALMTIIVIASTQTRADTGTCGGQMISLPFTDVPASNVFFCSIAEAYFSALTNGTTPTTYSPSANVPREQMAAFITRTLDQSLKRGHRRAALDQFWTIQGGNNLGLTDVGTSPLLVKSDGTNIWVPNSTSNTVSVVRASTGAVLGTLSGNGLNGPVQAAFDGERILVTNYGGNSVSLWKATDLTPIGTFSTGASTFPFGACSDGFNFWVTLQGTGKLARF
jgi:DNA-binding beta-propeller fold protein YncE